MISPHTAPGTHVVCVNNGRPMHTPGPWVSFGSAVYGPSPQDVDHRFYRGFDVVQEGDPGFLVAESIPHKPTRDLITAAPELLDALIMVRDADDDCHRDGLPTIPPMARAKIDAAIAKAEAR